MDQQQQTTETAVEDLTVTENEAEEVKGGAQVDYFLKLHGVDGEATGLRPSAPSVSEVVVTKANDIS